MNMNHFVSASGLVPIFRPLVCNINDSIQVGTVNVLVQLLVYECIRWPLYDEARDQAIISAGSDDLLNIRSFHRQSILKLLNVCLSPSRRYPHKCPARPCSAFGVLSPSYLYDTKEYKLTAIPGCVFDKIDSTFPLLQPILQGK